MEIAVIGGEEFCLGFRLAGVKKIFETDEPRGAMSSVEADSEVGVVIFDESLIGKLDSNDRAEIEDSLKPVYITISKEPSEGSLKKMIRKSIGVEL